RHPGRARDHGAQHEPRRHSVREAGDPGPESRGRAGPRGSGPEARFRRGDRGAGEAEGCGPGFEGTEPGDGGETVSVTHVPKPWGEEVLFAHTGRYAGKILRIRAGESLSLQYHERKEETLYLYQGSLRLLLPDAPPQKRDQTLEPGSAVHLPAKTRHRMEALTDCVVFEV